MHSPEDVRLRRLAHGVLLIIRQDHHVFSGVTEVLVEIGRHVLNIVDTSAQLPLLIEIVDTDQQRLPLSCAARILEVVALGCTMAERDRSTRRGRGSSRSSMMSLAVGVAVTRWWHACCALALMVKTSRGQTVNITLSMGHGRRVSWRSALARYVNCGCFANETQQTHIVAIVWSGGSVGLRGVTVAVGMVRGRRVRGVAAVAVTWLLHWPGGG